MVVVLEVVGPVVDDVGVEVVVGGSVVLVDVDVADTADDPSSPSPQPATSSTVAASVIAARSAGPVRCGARGCMARSSQAAAPRWWTTTTVGPVARSRAPEVPGGSLGPPLPGEAPLTFLVILIVLVVLAGLALVLLYNNLVRLRNRIEGAWAQIDVQLKRRYDLIPNLVETVKGYASHERETLDAVVRARNAAGSASGPADQAQAETMVTSALRQVFALSEAYPDLKANQGFLQLQEELAGTEGRISYARQYYNDTVLRYNTKIQTFPAVLIANAMRFQEREYFEADDTSRGPVQVQF